MINILLFVFLCCLGGVVGGDKVSVMEGDSLTLQTHLQIERDEETQWRFNDILIAEVSADIPTYVESGQFTNKLKLDHQTGSLTITNTRSTDTGDYTFTTTIGNKPSTKMFNVIVYVLLPIPAITSNISQCSSHSSSPKCSVVCSVLNVNHATLSWYKGNSLLSSISVSDLKSSLPLEVEYQENNTYSCVINNPFSNRTTHLCITDLCRMCSGEDQCNCYRSSEVLFRLAVTALVGLASVAAFIVLLYDIKSRRAEQE